MSDFKKNKNGHNNMSNKPQGFNQPHGTPMAPEGEKQHKNMSNGGKNEHNKQNMNNKSNGKCSGGMCTPNKMKCDCTGKCDCNCNCNCSGKNCK